MCPRAFKERIDLARQLGIITDEVHSELEKIRDMRNRFAIDDRQNLEEGEINWLSSPSSVRTTTRSHILWRIWIA